MSSIGRYNSNLKESIDRLERMKIYKDLSTVLVCPLRKDGKIPYQVVESWLHILKPINHRVAGPIFIVDQEVASAYNSAIEKILTDPGLCQFKYVLTLESDNIIPPDGLLKLYENMEEYDAVGGLYWTKEESGNPLMWGNPKEFPANFIPQLPVEGGIVPVRGLSMGFTLFKLDMFRKVEYPWFKTIQEFSPEKSSTDVIGQDMYFFDKAGKQGFKFAVDCRVLVGHLDESTGIIW